MRTYTNEELLRHVHIMHVPQRPIGAFHTRGPGDVATGALGCTGREESGRCMRHTPMRWHVIGTWHAWPATAASITLCGSGELLADGWRAWLLPTAPPVQVSHCMVLHSASLGESRLKQQVAVQLCCVSDDWPTGPQDTFTLATQSVSTFAIVRVPYHLRLHSRNRRLLVTVEPNK
jgi:hypothetical protein